MKTKRFGKKLALGKRTIANLDANVMMQIKGMGTDFCTATCESICPDQCPETETTVGSWLPCISVDDCGHTGLWHCVPTNP